MDELVSWHKEKYICLMKIGQQELAFYHRDRAHQLMWQKNERETMFQQRILLSKDKNRILGGSKKVAGGEEKIDMEICTSTRLLSIKLLIEKLANSSGEESLFSFKLF